jgi:hypothetical protein
MNLLDEAMVHSNVTSLGGTDVVDDSVVDVLC